MPRGKRDQEQAVIFMDPKKKIFVRHFDFRKNNKRRQGLNKEGKGERQIHKPQHFIFFTAVLLLFFHLLVNFFDRRIIDGFDKFPVSHEGLEV